MAKKTWEILIIILGIALDVAMLVKDKLTGGGKHDNGSGSTKKE